MEEKLFIPEILVTSYDCTNMKKCVVKKIMVNMKI